MRHITKVELKLILQNHLEYVNDNSKIELRANLSGADLSGADLRRANLSGADLDYSCLPLWCGGLLINIDDRLGTQFLYHTIQNILTSEYTSDEFKSAVSNSKIIEWCNRFHRSECERLEPFNLGDK